MLLDIDDAVNEARAKLVRAQKNVRGKSAVPREAGLERSGGEIKAMIPMAVVISVEHEEEV